MAMADGDDAPDSPSTAATEPRTPPAPEKPKTPETKPAPKADAKPADTKSVTAKDDSKPATASPAPEVSKYEKIEDIPSDEQASKMPAGKVSKALKLTRGLAEHYRKQAEELKDITKNPEYIKQVETAAKLQANFERAQQALRLKDYEQTEDYQNNFYKPFESAWNAGRTRIESLSVVERKDPNTDAVIQPARKATGEDFDRIVRETDDNTAYDLAEQLFGNKATIALTQREKVLDLAAKKTEALARMKTEGTEAIKRLTEANQKNLKAANDRFQAEIKAGATKPWLQPVEGDTEGNSLLEQGIKYVDSIYGGVFEDGDGNVIKNPTPAQKAERTARIRNMAAAFPRLRSQLKSARSENKALKAELAQYKASQPGAGDGSGPHAANNGQNTMQRAKNSLSKLAA